MTFAGLITRPLAWDGPSVARVRCGRLIPNGAGGTGVPDARRHDHHRPADPDRLAFASSYDLVNR
jgi:hypothetical protein